MFAFKLKVLNWASESRLISKRTLGFSSPFFASPETKATKICLQSKSLVLLGRFESGFRACTAQSP